MGNLQRKLYLVPSLLAAETSENVLPSGNKQIISNIEYFFAEDLRSARRFLSEWQIGKKIEDLHFFKLDKDSSKEQILAYLKEIPETYDIAMISEAGCPCIADPGSVIVSIAHENNWDVIPLVGPSSIILALIASGFNGQSFTFNGYLPIEKDKKEKMVRDMERISLERDTTQIFMETPYRNNKMVEDLLRICKPATMLCIAADLTSNSQFIRTKKISDWKAETLDLNKRPAIFLLSSK